ncbi:hypothetical protein GE118_00540 [Mycoplasma sp. NEAQ87857]|uniref:hypothetical protein n=1 Tax=Mycoplasma sp. NEAQ87857 TaxID=2683967 RepID=UPI001316DA36|nr:hypothetical protein [Mycoplasma sp. NEAQ87857]QGZ97291.1 hypothetical protein GE118_00540 [Mycoplasma sp. NEAQ87857]
MTNLNEMVIKLKNYRKKMLIFFILGIVASMILVISTMFILWWNLTELLKTTQIKNNTNLTKISKENISNISGLFLLLKEYSIWQIIFIAINSKSSQLLIIAIALVITTITPIIFGLIVYIFGVLSAILSFKLHKLTKEIDSEINIYLRTKSLTIFILLLLYLIFIPISYVQIYILSNATAIASFGVIIAFFVVSRLTILKFNQYQIMQSQMINHDEENPMFN